MSVAVLMYHGVGDSPAPHAELRYTVSPGRFESHLDLLLRCPGRRVGSLDDLIHGGQGPDDLLITFDDGEQTVATVALPAMARRGIRGAVFVTTNWIGQPGYLTEDQLLMLRDAGWTVAPTA